MNTSSIPSRSINRLLIYINVAAAFVYMSWWFLPIIGGNALLYKLLVAGEVYHVIMSLIFWFTIMPNRDKRLAEKYNSTFTPSVDVYITVTGEPMDVVRKTVKGVLNLDYPNYRVYILNDGYVAKKENWKEMEILAKELGISCITRKKGGGAKAGNINHALSITNGEYITIFDADMTPHHDYFTVIMPYFQDEKVAFVQTPQYYMNKDLNDVTAGAWEQQELFFGAIMKGKDKDNAAFICGTNFVMRKKALLSIGGFDTESIAEDVVTSVHIHQKGWKSHYIDKILCEGLGPEDLLSYYKQQRRWAFGSLTLLFSIRHNPLFARGLTFKQKIHYLSSVLFYINGIVVAIDIVMPLIYFYWGIRPVDATTTSFALFFIPYIFLILYTLFEASGRSVTFRALAFSQSAWFLQIISVFTRLLGGKIGFDVTSKKELKGNFLYLATPHILYILLGTLGMVFALVREGMNYSLATNIAWFIFNAFMFLAFIKAAYPWHLLLGQKSAVTYKQYE